MKNLIILSIKMVIFWLKHKETLNNSVLVKGPERYPSALCSPNVVIHTLILPLDG